MSERLAGQVAWISGGASGIGAATARLFAQEGASVVIADCSHVTILPGVLFEDEDAPSSIARCHDELAWRVERSRDAGIVFGVEAHVGSIVPTPQQALKLVASVPGLTLTVDYTHFARDGRPDSEAEPLLAHASHFHVRGARQGRLQCSFKDNTIDYGRVIEVLKQRDYGGFVGIEYIWIDWEHGNENDNLSETILFRDYLRARKDQCDDSSTPC